MSKLRPHKLAKSFAVYYARKKHKNESFRVKVIIVATQGLGELLATEVPAKGIGFTHLNATTEIHFLAHDLEAAKNELESMKKGKEPSICVVGYAMDITDKATHGWLRDVHRLIEGTLVKAGWPVKFAITINESDIPRNDFDEVYDEFRATVLPKEIEPSLNISLKKPIGRAPWLSALQAFVYRTEKQIMYPDGEF